MTMMKRGILFFLFAISTSLLPAQNGVSDCFDGTFSLDDNQCAFIAEPIAPDCGPLRYYLPSLWRNNALFAPSSLFIYSAFDSANVRIFSSDGIDGASPEFEDNILVTNGAPVDYVLITSTGVENRSVQSTAYNTVETSRGLIIESDVPITVVYRLNSAANKSFFVLKGQEGLGYGFSAASQTDVTVPATPFEAHFVSVMALEDNTQIRFQKDNYAIEGATNDNTNTNDINITNGLLVTLNAGETYMIRDNVQSSSSVTGLLVTADKPITVASGSSHTRHGSGFNDRDAGMDQLIPINKAGEEYIAVRGTNNTDIDYLMLIGISDNTIIEINGTPVDTIDSGEVMEYKLTGAGGAIFHVSGDNIFCAYHVSGVFDEEVGMAQLPAIEECSGNSTVDIALIGTDDHIINVIIPNLGLPSLELNGTPYTSFATARSASGTSLSVVTFDQSDLLTMGNRITSNELFHVGVTTGSAVGGSYGYLTKYGNELVLFDPSDGIPLNVASFDAFVAASIASTTGFSQDIGVITCTPPASIVRVNGNNSNFTTVNNGLVSFTGQQVNYTSSNSFIGFEDLEVMVEDAAGQSGAVCIRIGVFQDEVCGNGIDDDLDGQIDEQEECPTNPCLDDCNNTGCEPEIQEVFTTDPTCDDLTAGGIGILSSSQNVEYSINNGSSYQDDASFFDLSSGTYMVIVRYKATGCTAAWPGNPISIVAPDCTGCLADAGDPRAKQSFCKLGNTTNVSVAPNTNTFVPPGYETVYILTKEPDLLILDYKINNSNFNIPGTGNFRIHTLIAEVNNTNSDDFLDMSIVKKNQSTLIIIIQCISNHEVCAALDIKGTLIQILDDTDPACSSTNLENTIRKCNDNTDNDGDGLVDCRDPDCQSFMICNEDNAQNCNDGIDNDGDGLIDCEDDQCLEFIYCDENGKQCNDGIDNDADGLVDCADPNCADEVYCNEDNVITCCDGIDNDGDGRFDCDDTQCSAWLYCREHTFAACTDGIDNDLDGLVDCADPNCQALDIFQCRQENSALNCSDGIDNDEDGLTDCFDTECAAFSICDNDGDGLAGVLDINDDNPCIPFRSDKCTDPDIIDLESKTDLTFDLKVILEGPYDIYNGVMNKRLNEQGYLPGQKPWTFFGTSTPVGQPYSGAPWFYEGDEGESYNATIANDRFAGYDDNVVDWVLLSLRTNKTKDTEVFRTAAFLHIDGSIDIVEGHEFNNLEQRGYYVVIEHRNHMAVMSTNLALAVNGKMSYDFSSADSYNIGLGHGQKQLADGTFVMIAGNPETTGGTASYTDVNIRDLNAITRDQGENSGYYQCDLDLDGDVNTQDKSICLGNNGMFITLKF